MRWNGNCKASVNGQLGEVFKRVERGDRCYKNIRHTAVLYSCSCKLWKLTFWGSRVQLGSTFYYYLASPPQIWQILIKIWHLCIDWQTLSFWIKNKKELPAPKYWNLNVPSRWKMWVEEEQTVGGKKVPAMVWTFLIEADSSRLLGQGSHFLYILHSRRGFQTFGPWINKSITT